MADPRRTRLLTWRGALPSVAGAVAAVALIGCGSEGTKTVTETETVLPSATVTTDDAAPTPAPAPEQLPAGAGKKVGLGRTLRYPDAWSVTVTGRAAVKTLSGPVESHTADGKYVVVTMRVKNLTSRPVDLGFQLFTVVDSDGNVYEADIEASIDGIEEHFSDSLPPGVAKSGSLAFELPSEARARYLRVASTPDDTEVAFLDDADWGLIRLPA